MTIFDILIALGLAGLCLAAVVLGLAVVSKAKLNRRAERGSEDSYRPPDDP